MMHLKSSTIKSDLHISELLEKLNDSYINDELFHAALATRNETIIRIFLTRVPISRITPEQLEFFTPLGGSAKERMEARFLGNILFEYNYKFGQDETSQWFFQIIMKNDITHGH